ncbi:hypothetical protein Gohar_018462, partial [Gossypium harknessii]|nr:hypothetical protein [Gossypium harknessii]
EDLDDRSEIRDYILNVKHLKGNFISCKFKYASRTGNNVAHTLAKEGLRVKDDTYINNRLSGTVLAVVAEDCRGLLRSRPINGIGSVKRTWSWLGCPEKQSSKKRKQRQIKRRKESILTPGSQSYSFIQSSENQGKREKDEWNGEG